MSWQPIDHGLLVQMVWALWDDEQTSDDGSRRLAEPLVDAKRSFYSTSCHVKVSAQSISNWP